MQIEVQAQVSGAVATALHERRTDVSMFVEGPATDGLDTRLFRQDGLMLVQPAGQF